MQKILEMTSIVLFSDEFLYMFIIINQENVTPSRLRRV